MGTRARKSPFERLADVVVRRYRIIAIVWILLLVGSLYFGTLHPVSDILSYSQEGSLPKDTESARAQAIADEQFPGRETASGMTIVVISDNVTDVATRDFVLDLHRAIVASGTIHPGNPGSVVLQGGQTVQLTEAVRYLSDPSNATIYSAYEGAAAAVVTNLNPVVHQQVGFTQGSLYVYFGLPETFRQAYLATNNTSMAYATTVSTLGGLPTDQQTMARGYLGVYVNAWNLSLVTNPSWDATTRTDATIAQALPAFVNGGPYDAATKAYQLGYLTTFNRSNFTNETTIEAYAFGALAPVAQVTMGFLGDLYHGLPANATPDQVRRFSAAVVDNHTLYDLPFTLPFDLKKFYISSDQRIMLLNYEFTKASGFEDVDQTQPIMDDVVVFRDLVRMLLPYHPGPIVYVSGTAASEYDQRIEFGGGREYIATILLVVILIGIYFRSVVSPGVPLGAIGIAQVISNVFVFFVGFYLLTIDVTVTTILQTVLLATGTDYSIFLISRYRDERLAGHSVQDSVHMAITWAGESIATSGGAVMISFAGLSLASFPFVRVLGITIGMAVTIAILIALTLVPGILLLVGDRVFWPFNRRMARVQKARLEGHRTAVERYFEGSAKFSMKHAKAILVAALLISGPTTYIILTSTPSYDFSKGAAPTESSRGVDAIKDAFGAGLFLRTFVLVRFPDGLYLADGNPSVARLGAIDDLRAALLADHPEIVQSIEGPTNPQGNTVDYRNLSNLPPTRRAQVLASMASFVGRDNRTVRLFVVLKQDVFSGPALDSIGAMTATASAVQARDPDLGAATIYFGGVTAVLNDVRTNTNRDFQVMAAFVMTSLFIVLLVVMGSVLIPLRSILTILLSISWTLASTIVIFHFFRGLDLLFILPLIVFVLAMGLGMDYDIFIITRVREEVARGKDDREAIYTAMKRTGAIISAAGAVMAGSFLTLTISPSPVVVQIAFALAFVILLDSMVVRIYLVPAIMVLAGRFNWWAPGPFQRVHREQKRPTPHGATMAAALILGGAVLVAASAWASWTTDYRYSVDVSRTTMGYGLVASAVLLGLFLLFLLRLSRGRTWGPGSVSPVVLGLGPLFILAGIAALDAWGLVAVDGLLRGYTHVNTTLVYITSYGLGLAVFMVVAVGVALLRSPAGSRPAGASKTVPVDILDDDPPR